MRLVIEPSVCVITPTIGKKELIRAMESVAKQTYSNLTHLIVIDGNKFWKDTQKVLDINHDRSNVLVTTSPYNTGANHMYGHRIYAGYPHLVDMDYIFFLDEDNWWDSDHISSLIQLIELEGLDFAHSLRTVYNKGEFLADDCCEAIGRWPIGWQPDQHLVDTSSFAFRRTFLIQVCQLWHSGWGGDRRFFMSVKDRAKYNTTGLHTLNYELPDMDKAYGGQVEIFEKYNDLVKQQYGGKYPWEKT